MAKKKKLKENKQERHRLPTLVSITVQSFQWMSSTVEQIRNVIVY